MTSADGQSFTDEGNSTITITVPKAMAGEWKYAVIAITLPNENFPFTVTVGQK